MTEAIAHDMSQFWRIFTYQHNRISGTFVVHADKDAAHHVKPYDVTIWADDSHSWGRVVKSDDFTAFVKAGEIEIPAHMIREAVRADIEDARDELIVAIRACVEAFPLGSGDPS